MNTPELPPASPLPERRRGVSLPGAVLRRYLKRTPWQFLRFGLVGCLNTFIDLLTLNWLLRLLPAPSLSMLVLINSTAYALGAINSFILNRYWTFRQSGRPQLREIWRFGITTLVGIACNDVILGVLNNVLSILRLDTPFWMNVAKLAAIAGTILISFLGLRLWVFVHRPPTKAEQPEQISCIEEKIPFMFDTFGISGLKDWETTLRMELQHKLALGAIMLIALFTNFYRLGQNGFGNLFYAAGVRSMTDSLHNFFFVSYDPGGFVTIDKPPLGFWLQALSVKLFGFIPFSIFFPQALAGLLSVLILFLLVRRHFGAAAGLLAALALAISPLSVATNRNNTIDSTLTLVLLLAAWAIMLAAETGKWRWLLLSAVLVGLGFNIKMLEAYLVVPAFGLLYLLAAPRSFWMRVWQLAVTMLVLLVVSLSWATAVDLTSASQRPYVGSSPNNSAISLALGYNGVDRLLGRSGRDQRDTQHADLQFSPPNAPTSSSLERGSTSPLADAASENDAWRAFRSRTGSPGPLRLLADPLGGQIAWLLPIALLGMIALAWQRRPRWQQDFQQQSLLLWGMWLLTMGAFFSIASFFHQYYMTTLAPAICALFGIGLAVMWRDYRRSNWRGWLLPLALLLTAAEQIYLISSNPAWGSWLIPLIALLCLLAVAVLVGAPLLSRFTLNKPIIASSFSIGVAALLLTPAIWSAMPGLQNIAGSTPLAGPSPTRAVDILRRNDNTVSTALIRYLEENRGKAKFLVATLNSRSANGIILATNKPVMAMGGFSGADPILDRDQLSSLINDGVVRFFLLTSTSRQPQLESSNQATGAETPTPTGVFNMFGTGRNSQNALTTWITQHCSLVPATTWQPGISATAHNAAQLYDCRQGK